MKRIKGFAVTADNIVFTIDGNSLKVLLIKRKNEPFKNMWAFPGGFVEVNEDLEDAAIRELYEETGVKNVQVKQLGAFGDPKRDPRGRIVTVAYISFLNKEKINLKAGSDAKDAKLFSADKIPKLATDHNKILNQAIQKIKHENLFLIISELLPKYFKLTEFQEYYEILKGKKFDKRNFRKKILRLKILQKTKNKGYEKYRPASLYCFKKLRQKSTFILFNKL